MPRSLPIGGRACGRALGRVGGGRAWLRVAMPSRFLVGEPHVSRPQDEVQKTEHHGHVEARHDGGGSARANLLLLTDGDELVDSVGHRGDLDVGEALGPGGGAHEPHEGKECSYDEVYEGSAVLLVLGLVEGVHDQGKQRVEEGKHGDGHKEFGRRGEVAVKVANVLGVRRTVGYRECHLV